MSEGQTAKQSNNYDKKIMPTKHYEMAKVAQLHNQEISEEVYRMGWNACNNERDLTDKANYDLLVKKNDEASVRHEEHTRHHEKHCLIQSWCLGIGAGALVVIAIILAICL